MVLFGSNLIGSTLAANPNKLFTGGKWLMTFFSMLKRQRPNESQKAVIIDVMKYVGEIARYGQFTV